MTADKPIPLAQQTAPERIYLDIGAAFAMDEPFEHDTTWSKDNATGFGVQYVRADLAQAVQEGNRYSIDADQDGIRARVADAIIGALAFGAQNSNPPPKGHWLQPFWEMARATQHGTDGDWKTLFWDVAKELKCLPSSFVSGNDHVLRKARELTAAQAVPAGWMPIESAPKDRHVLLQVVTRLGKRSDTVWCSGYWAGDYWVIYNADEAVQRVEPSGWQPLPAAPQAPSGGECETNCGALGCDPGCVKGRDHG